MRPDVTQTFLASLSAGVVALALALTGCDTNVDRPDASTFRDDATLGMLPPIPLVDMVPARAPYPVVTLRGRALMARRVIVEGAGNPIATAILPDGTFCVDVPLRMPGAFTLDVRAQNAEGRLSARPASVMTTLDPSAAPIPGATTCSGGDPAGCSGATENCTNGRDDDCNGLVDERDPMCVTCMDDALEPNDDANAPRIETGRVDGLQICPNDPDYYGVFARAGDTITARIFFSSAAGDLDLALFDIDHTTRIESSEGSSDTESVSRTVTREGQYVLQVYGYGGARNTYALDVQVQHTSDAGTR